ncbi:hypothetical protein Pmani_031044 [Petrolisthes manimaculis]|uniref:Uncharacterized protein n=1 Tax=Petrolisthes manimaculis TaxID=1843537 RepID=A0AAE1TSC9_9EUCA|nr:hypothetical protein Pmani_035553 [Petrolisthes manimaculis]KAK4296463.1 hypothetical protein Pmani_031044 [Petrolisthes manimaculis]
MNSEAGRRQLEAFVECQRKGDVGHSFSHLSLALCLLPHLKHQYYNTFLRVFEEWSDTVEETKGIQQALTISEAALSIYPHSPDIQYLLAKILYR